MNYILIMLAIVAYASIGNSYAGTQTEIYFARHAETLGNATHKHNHKNDRTFSKKGKQQVARLTAKLDALHFDAIVVSPKYRVLNTIFPYLKKHHLKAEIWPELQECCWQPKTTRLSSSTLQRGKRIHLESAMQSSFIFPNADAQRRYAAKNYGDGLLQTFKAVQLIRQRFAGSGKRILIVGHYHSGARLIEILQGIEPDGRYQLSNTKVSHLRETSDGSFQLIDLNQ